MGDLRPDNLKASDFKTRLLQELSQNLSQSPATVAAWEAGSAATRTSDEFSDIDLNVVGTHSFDAVWDIIETTLNEFSTITHRRIEKPFWPGCYQRVYFIDGAPKHFFVDVAVLLQTSTELLHEFLDVDRHGVPVVLFDRGNILRPHRGNANLVREKQRTRLGEIEAAYPVYRTTVQKEIDRNHPIDAFGFYYGGLVRSLVELLGMLHRAPRYDFGLRYLHRDLPANEQAQLEKFLYVSRFGELNSRLLELDQLYEETRISVRKKLGT